jgi:sulfite exporter TauE/SafE
MTPLDPAHLSLWAALIAGLAGSGHCLAMCGGIAGALAMRGNARNDASRARPAAGPSFRSRLSLALAYNVARVASYSLAGALAGLLGHALLRAVDVAPLSFALRIVAGLVMVAAAGRLLFGWRLLDPLEALGATLWRKLLPWASPAAARRDGLGGAVLLGLAWGWLPCGLTYSMLLLAATTADAVSGAAVMAAFGLGTLPAMVSATVAFDRAARLLASKATLRTVAGSLLLAFGLWTAGNAAYHAFGHGAHSGHSMSPAGHQPGAAQATPAGEADPHAGHVMPPPETTEPAGDSPAPAGPESHEHQH